MVSWKTVDIDKKNKRFKNSQIAAVEENRLSNWNIDKFQSKK